MFIWASTDEKRRTNLGAWHHFCFPIDEGGLSFRRLGDMQEALSWKLWWRLRTIKNLWSEFMCLKYLDNKHPTLRGVKLKDSGVWKRLICGASKAERFIRWRFGTGDIYF